MPTNKDPKGKQICVTCKENLPFSNFYSSKSELFSLTGKVPMCKKCMYEKSLDINGDVDLELFKEILRKVDKPFILKLWQSALNEADKYKLTGNKRSKHAFSYYWKNINSLKQYKHFTYKDSDDINKRMRVDQSNDIQLHQMQVKQDSEEKHYSELGEFEVTEDIKDLFGDGYQTIEYKKMKEKYDKLTQNYILQTNLHQEALATYVRFKVKEEMATAKGDVVDAKKWYDAAIDAADKAKLTPKQLTKADLQKGLNSFSEISQALEQAVDIIQILPRFKNQPNDSVDFNIWCYINYARKLKGLPTVAYEEVYKFYDDMRDEYISQYGDPYNIFDGDTTLKNRENVKKFIVLPEDYDTDDPGGDDD